MPGHALAPLPPPGRSRYALTIVVCVLLLVGIGLTLTEPSGATTVGFAGRLVSPVSLLMLSLAPISRGTTQRLLIALGLILGVAGLALILAGHRA